MASTPSGPDKRDHGGQGQGKRLSAFHQYDLETGTKLWRQKLEGNMMASPSVKAQANAQANAQVKTQSPAVQGGLPPHLLFRKANGSGNTNSPASALSRGTTQEQQTQTSEASAAKSNGTPKTLTPAASCPAPNAHTKQSFGPACNKPSHTASGPHQGFSRNQTPGASQNRASGWTPAATPTKYSPFNQKQVSTQHAASRSMQSHKASGPPQGFSRSQAPGVSGNRASEKTPAAMPTGSSPLAQKQVSTQPIAESTQSRPAAPLTPAYNGEHKTFMPEKEHLVPHPALKQALGETWEASAAVPAMYEELSPPGVNGGPQSGKEKWRPKHSCDAESQSLPETISSLGLGRDGFSSQNFNSDENAANKSVSNDIRAEIADELDIAKKQFGDGWYKKEDWNSFGVSSVGGKDPYEKSWRPGYVSQWVQKTSKEEIPVAFFLKANVERHEECDVDPFSAFLIPPVEYPDTIINNEDVLTTDEMTRRLSGTSDITCALMYEKLKKRVAVQEKKDRLRDAINPPADWVPVENPFPVPQTTPSPTHGSSNQPVADPANQMGNTEGAQGYIPKIQCFLRPAEESDIPQVLSIYNWEVANGCQALDVEPLTTDDMQRVFSTCQAAKTPFIVAVQGTPEEAAARKETPAPYRGPYQNNRFGPYQAHTRPYQQAPLQKKPELDKVLGFGFISLPMPGLAGGMHHNVGRFLGRAHVFVDNEFRRKNIGRSLLHRLTQFSSICCADMGYYDWFDTTGSAVFEKAGFNARNYSRLFVEIASKGKTDPATGWYQKFLESENFVCVSTMDQFRKIGHGDDAQWLDNLVWQLDCQHPDTVKENGNNN